EIFTWLEFRRVLFRSGDNSMDIVDLYECYVKVDIDGDGIAETCRVYYAGAKDGGAILDWEEWEDETPFDDIPCNPMPHRWEAQRSEARRVGRETTSRE